MDPFLVLGDVEIQEIFTYLSALDIVRAGAVSKRWKLATEFHGYPMAIRRLFPAAETMKAVDLKSCEDVGRAFRRLGRCSVTILMSTLHN